MVRSALILVFLLQACSTSSLTGHNQLLLVSDSIAVSQLILRFVARRGGHDEYRVTSLRELASQVGGDVRTAARARQEEVVDERNSHTGQAWGVVTENWRGRRVRQLEL